MDSGIIDAEVVCCLSHDTLNVKGAGFGHLPKIHPVLGAIEERLEHGQVATGKERNVVTTESFGARPGCDLFVEVGCIEEQVDRRLVPPQTGLGGVRR